MTEKKPSPLDVARARLSRGEIRWLIGEQQATATLIKSLGLPPSVRRDIEAAALAANRDKPVLADFRKVVSCDVYITYREHKELRASASLANIFPYKKYQQKWFITTFIEARVDLASELTGQPLALLFKWPYLDEPMVLHSAAYNETSPGLRLVLTHDNRELPKLTLEPLSQFLSLLSNSIHFDVG
jgi:hypothetical protein